jgi:hypothetical protein
VRLYVARADLDKFLAGTPAVPEPATAVAG